MLEVLLDALLPALLHDCVELPHERLGEIAHHAARRGRIEVVEQLLRVLALEAADERRLMVAFQLLEKLNRLLARAEAEDRDALVGVEMVPAVGEIDRADLFEERTRRDEFSALQKLREVSEVYLQRLHIEILTNGPPLRNPMIKNNI